MEMQQCMSICHIIPKKHNVYVCISRRTSCVCPLIVYRLLYNLSLLLLLLLLIILLFLQLLRV